jgi:hypothetical protein
MSKERIVKLTLPVAVAVTILLSLPAVAGPHDAGYYKCNAGNGTTYWRYVKKRSDAQETAFKQAVTGAAGIGNGCRSVSYPSSEPTGGTGI